MLDDAHAEVPIVEFPPRVPEEKKPRVWTVFAAFAASLFGAIALQAALVLILLAWWTAQGAAPKEVIHELPKRLGGLGMFILLASCGQVAMLLTILAAARMSPSPWRERLGLLPPRSSWRVNSLAMAGSLVPLTLGFAIASPLSDVLRADPTVLTLFESMTRVDWIAFILFIATVPAVIEEIMFRGYMQRRLLERWRPLAAIGVTSGLFATMHVMPLAVVALFPLSVWLGVVAWRTGSVYPTMLCHAFINGGVNAWRMVVKLSEWSETVQVVVLSVVMVGSAVCLVLAWRGLFGGDANCGGVESGGGK